MAHEIEVQWMGKMQFNALVNGHTIVMDGPEKVGGEDQGTIPKPLVLTALAGCTGMDIAAILRKADKNPDDFEMKVTGEISKKPPIEYVAIHVVYNFKGKEENGEAALKAVTDSQEKYCGVSHMLKKALPVTWEVNYNGKQIFNNKIEIAEELSMTNLEN
ncbi:MAG: OsmC family peroxiredoxin [Chitinophagaceae bacterium]|nr:MAG: OsmC family peroxiredoxin [Chitinophagaceae bacterium]